MKSWWGLLLTEHRNHGKYNILGLILSRDTNGACNCGSRHLRFCLHWDRLLGLDRICKYECWGSTLIARI